MASTDGSAVPGRELLATERERLLDLLDEADCRRLLATAIMGRIAFTEGAMPAIQPVSFALRGEDVLIPTGLGSKMAAGSRGAVLAFEVDDYDLVERTGWNVTVIGPSRLISDPDQVRTLDALGVRPWAPAFTHCYIALRMAVVRGRCISSTDVRGEPVDAAGDRSATPDPAGTPA
ncbi:MAG: pyridoxamine 5-phosphate oxidase-related FMN-binding protein [Frankiales bacterium]|nr:pyridoxamine 5-phosphate oxidase-related FMN-binding protein [Frankiales bacterium]